MKNSKIRSQQDEIMKWIKVSIVISFTIALLVLIAWIAAIVFLFKFLTSLT